MTHLSGSVSLVSAVVGFALWMFAWYRMWKFDKLQCLNVCAMFSNRRARKRGGFLRIMTWTFLVGLPMYFIYFLGLTVIKYNEGFLTIPSLETQLPMPHQLWPVKYRRLIVPLYYCFSVSNFLSGITMVEDLCFWFYMLKRDAVKNSFAQSWEFRFFILLASVQTGVLLGAVAIGSGDPLKIEGVLFLTVGITQLIVSICFLYIIYIFPDFLEDALQAGVPRSVYQRLKAFHELNMFRTFFRVVYCISIIIPSIAGFSDHDLDSPINIKLFWTDLWPITALIGWSVSAGTTIMIFYPAASDREDDRLFSSLTPSQPSQTETTTRSRSRHATLSASSSMPKTPENHHVANFSRPLPLSSSPPEASKSTEPTGESTTSTLAKKPHLSPVVAIDEIPMETLAELGRERRPRETSDRMSTGREGSTYTVETNAVHGRLEVPLPASRKKGAIRASIRSYRTPLEIPDESDEEDHLYDDDSDLVP